MKVVTDTDYSFRIHITSKPKNFRFRFIASNNNNNFFRFSLLIKLHKFFLTITSRPTQTQKQNHLILQIHSNKNNKLGFIRTKFIKFVRNFRDSLSKKRRFPNIAAKRESILPYPKDPNHIGFWVVGFLTFIAQSINKKDQKVIMVLASIGFFAYSLLFNKFKTAKLVNFAALVLVVATIVSYRFSYLDNNYLDYIARSTSNKMESIIGYVVSSVALDF
ncbi:PREDICTED: uncharacterized protein LOC109360083 [Lupinus angustifolius]|uniref:uncharacterized protein LOC109360083 n=1 Tax=Lupinus angustifolius TaxID=3871 RepID=UPI00092F6527|nr:PREDICTED: uncharacterized protein LOC109360083 [Lupinus angustifolius]